MLSAISNHLPEAHTWIVGFYNDAHMRYCASLTTYLFHHDISLDCFTWII